MALPFAVQGVAAARSRTLRSCGAFALGPCSRTLGGKAALGAAGNAAGSLGSPLAQAVHRLRRSYRTTERRGMPSVPYRPSSPFDPFVSFEPWP